MTGAADRSGWRMVLIGASRFSHPDFQDLPAVANNITDLAERLTVPSDGAVAEQHCTVMHNPSLPWQVGTAITQAAAEAEDVLLFYFSGHGKLGQDGSLHLVLRDSDPHQIELSSVPFSVVKRKFSKSRARARIVILDCCYSGNAIETMSTSADLITSETQNIEGTYVLTSSPKNKTSLAPTGDRHTAFTAALLAAATDTDLTLDQLYASTAEILKGRGQPEPQCRVHNSAHALRLFAPPIALAAPAVADSVDVDELAVLNAAQQGDVDSMIELAQRFYGANDLEHAEQWWRLAAEAGDAGAMYNGAVVSEIQRRFEDGKLWYQRAAETGDTNAMHNLAIRLRLRGREAEAARWWQAAGHTSPQRNGEKLRKVVLRRNLPVERHARTDDEAPDPTSGAHLSTKIRPARPIVRGMTPDEVRNIQFSQSGLGKRGYSENEVDAFLDRVEEKIRDDGSNSLSSQDVRRVAFGKSPFGRRGYDMDEVDEFLDRVTEDLETRERGEVVGRHGEIIHFDNNHWYTFD